MFSEIQWMIFFCSLIDINDMQCVYQAAVSLILVRFLSHLLSSAYVHLKQKNGCVYDDILT